MGFFDEQDIVPVPDKDNNIDSDNLDSVENAEIADNSDKADEKHEKFIYELPKGAKSEKEVDADFWKGADKARRKRRSKQSARYALGKLCFMLLFVGVGVAITITTIRGSGWLSNMVTGGKNINFTLPVADKPQLDDEFQLADGRYTAEGVAKAFSPAVVSVEVYSNTGSYAASGQGSGVIMSADGYIVTNAHVVSAADAGIRVVLSDGTEYAAEVVGKDEATDIAVIKIKAQGLQAAEFGDSAQVKAGEDVVAIGSPAGYYGTVTKGIVSGVNRRIRLENSSIIMNCIQIDAAINPGNSGGALFNMWGQVIGITSSKLASSDYEGIGFAISIQEAKPVIEELMEKGFVSGRVKIGITYYTISETTAEMYDIEPGLCVVSVNPECDVANTSITEGDIITEIDGKPTADVSDVTSLFKDKNPGDEITCKVFRANADGSVETFDVTFKLMEDNGGLILDDSNENESENK